MIPGQFPSGNGKACALRAIRGQFGLGFGEIARARAAPRDV
jgi:hypothetical protein